MDIWGGEKIVLTPQQPCSVCRRTLAGTGYRFDGESIIVAVCGNCAPSWPLSKIVAKLNSNLKPKVPLMAARDFHPRTVAPIR